MCRIVNLLAPGDLGLEAVVNERGTNPLRGEKPTDVAIDIFAADTQGLVTGIQPPAVKEDHQGPVISTREKKIEAVFGILRAVAVGNVTDDSFVGPGNALIENGHACAPHPGVNP